MGAGNELLVFVNIFLCRYLGIVVNFLKCTATLALLKFVALVSMKTQQREVLRVFFCIITCFRMPQKK